MQVETMNAAANKTMGKTYRDFSRKRYAELKNAPGKKMREPEIIQKIIKEWDQIQNANKTRKAANKNNLNTPLKMEPMLMMTLDKKNTNLLKSTSAKREDINEERSSFEEELKNIEVMAFDSEDKPAKTKAIKKRRMVSNYIEFYKMHYERLMASHPYWSNNQATIIIKLMWKKQKMRGRAQKSNPARVVFKKRTGRMAHKNMKAKEGMNKDEITDNWKHLPRESRKMWQMIGDPEMFEAKDLAKSKTMVVNKSNSIQQMMQKRII